MDNDDHDEPAHAAGSESGHDEALRPAERLRARAAATDRASRFEARLAEVRRLQARRRRVRRLVRVGWVVAFAAFGGIAPIVVVAVLGRPDPSGWTLVAWAAVGALVGAVGPSLRNWLARRRGATAWDAYNERYVLLGDPSAEVRDADDGTARRSSLLRRDQRR